MLNYCMFSFKPIEPLTKPDWLNTASHDDLLNRQNQDHACFIEELSSIRDINRIPQMQRIESLGYLISAIFLITHAHAQDGLELYKEISDGSSFATRPVSEDHFPVEFKLIEKLFGSISFSKHMERCFTTAQDDILNSLNANDTWLSHKKNWPNLNPDERKQVVNLFYTDFCDHFSVSDKIITPPSFDDFTELGTLAGQLSADHDFNKDKLSTQVRLSTEFINNSFPVLCGILYHEGVHLVMNHLRFFAHSAPPPEDHPIANDVKLSFDLQNKRAQPVEFITGTNFWHPEERLAYKVDKLFEQKMALNM
jgi:hypothetical protein